jgi:hypothetical protein
MHSLRKPLAILLAVLIITIVATVIDYRTIPTHDTNLTHFDTIIVLGTPAKPDGTPSPEQRERTLEGVREFKAGVAPSIILTGGPAHNQFVEAHVMAMLAIAQGVPPEDVIEEDQAQNTIQNIFYSQRIMAAHQWTSGRGRQFTQPSSPHRAYPRALPARLAHPGRPMAIRVRILAARCTLLRRSPILPQAPPLRLPINAFPPTRFVTSVHSACSSLALHVTIFP